MKFSELGYRNIIIDSKLISSIVNDDYLMGGLEDFCHQGRIFVRGNPYQLADLVKRSNGGIILSNFSSEFETTLESVQNVHDNIDSDLFGCQPKQMRSEVLYLKNSEKPVLIDLVGSVYGLTYSAYKEKLDCGLRLVYHAMESCPHQCTYCFANYDWASPTIVLPYAHKQLEKDLKNKNIIDLIDRGFPIHIGSISDLASTVSCHFDLLTKAVNVIKKAGARIFIGTKSTHIADDYYVNLLKSISDNIIVTFSFTNLTDLETNLPYNARRFPTPKIQKLTKKGIRVVLLYRPIIPGLNDDMEQISNTITEAIEAGVEQVGIGFCKFHIKILENLKKMESHMYPFINNMEKERIDDNYYPAFSYRSKTADQIIDICNEQKMNFFFLCQSFLNSKYSELETGCCICNPAYWNSSK
ncbi:MAG: hypothetical protein JEZ11_01415 [Desulfobacterales bacterium]|nr:hypothetical protein [Desulfobacterales bacterium]